MNIQLIRCPINKYTFKVTKIREWVEEHCIGLTLNLFAGLTKLNILREVRNDLDLEVEADYHLDALECVKQWHNPLFNTIILDPPYCYSQDTEILTEDGWLFLEDIIKNKLRIKVATLNQNGYLEYHYPNEYYQYYYEGIMKHFKQRNVDLLVTPNHNLYVSSVHNFKFNFLKAEAVKKGIKFKKNCLWKGIHQNFFILPSTENIRCNKYGVKTSPELLIPMKDWLRFLGIWLAEGCLKNRKRKNKKTASDYSIFITQKNKKNRKIIEQWLDKLPFKYYQYKYDYIINNKQLYKYLEKFGKVKNKYIPKEIKNLSSEFLMFLLEGLMLGDGCYFLGKDKYNKKYEKFYKQNIRRSYSSSSKKLIEDVNEIILKTGKSATIFLDKKNTYVLSIIERNNYPCINKNKLQTHIKDEYYKGFVYCLNIPNNIIYVKRNKQSVWCGNSLRKSMEFYEGRKVSKFQQIKEWIPKILMPHGRVITFGYQSVSMGKKRGFEVVSIAIFSHGGAIHDTIGTVEVKNGLI